MSVNVIGRPVSNLFARAWLRTTRKRMSHLQGLAIKLVADYIRTGGSHQRLHISGSPVIIWKLYMVFLVTGISKAHGAGQGHFIGALAHLF
jgi:hypothetical protein